MDFIQALNKFGGVSYIKKSYIVSVDEVIIDDMVEAARLGTAKLVHVCDINNNRYVIRGNIEDILKELNNE